MNPQYIFVSGETFYFLTMAALLIKSPSIDYPHESYEAMHRDAFGNAGGQPCRVGASYSKHFAVPGLYQLASG
jgi:hypothetical protein